MDSVSVFLFPWPSDIAPGPIGPRAISLALGLHKSRYCPERSVLFCKYINYCCKSVRLDLGLLAAFCKLLGLNYTEDGFYVALIYSVYDELREKY